jgi:hypothetical protein
MLFFPLNPLGAFILARLRATSGSIFGVTLGRRTQRSRATNQNVIVNNLGPVITGVQNANPVNS